MMVGTLGRPPKGGDVGPGRLIALGLVVSMVSFAGFRVTTDTKPMPPATEATAETAAAAQEVVTASIPSPIPSVLFPRLTTNDPNLDLSTTSPVASPEPQAPAPTVSSLVVPPPVDVADSLDDIP